MARPSSKISSIDNRTSYDPTVSTVDGIPVTFNTTPDNHCRGSGLPFTLGSNGDKEEAYSKPEHLLRLSEVALNVRDGIYEKSKVPAVGWSRPFWEMRMRPSCRMKRNSNFFDCTSQKVVMALPMWPKRKVLQELWVRFTRFKFGVMIKKRTCLLLRSS